MDFEIGIVCGACESYNPMGTERCSVCSHDLALFSTSGTSSPRLAAIDMTALAMAAAGAPLPVEAQLAAARSLGSGATIPAPFGSQEPAPQSTSGRGPVPINAPRPFDAARASPPSPAAPPHGKPETPAPRPGVAGRRPAAPDVSLQPDKLTEPRVKAAAPVDQASSLRKPSPTPRKQPPSFAHLTQEELMEQARHYLCWQCYTPVPSGHKFCGRCGAPVPPEIIEARTIYFSDMQNPAKARLVLIRGEGMDGVSYHLKMEQHVVGRKGQIPFPEDPFVSPKHANFFYRDAKLLVRDEGSLNGVYVRVRGAVDIAPGDTFLAGEQVFRLDLPPRINDVPDGEGTMFYASPKHQSSFRINQVLLGGSLGMTVCARGTALQLGREGGDLNFPADIYMSSSHCRIEESNGAFKLIDLSSRNGTYVRIKSERELAHGDYLFIGRKLMRVEMNA